MHGFRGYTIRRRLGLHMEGEVLLATLDLACKSGRVVPMA